MYRHVKIHALKPTELSGIDKLCRQFDPTSAGVQEKCVENKTYVLAPIQGIKHKAPAAYLLFVGVRTGQVESLKKRLSRDLTPMTKHIAFSLQHWAVQKLSFMDDLTTLYNQKYMSMVLENEIHRCQRDKSKFSVLFMDIDYFKSVNDTRGHLVGSRLLIELGHILKNNLRRSDYAFRYGGDEFVVVLPGTDSIGAQVAAERLRQMVEKTEFLVEGENIRLTLSIGLATYPDHAKTHKDIIKMADEAMYCGKNKSRNIVFVAS
jgi:diguanylate cyclase (GGDEF)-like protein